LIIAALLIYFDARCCMLPRAVAVTARRAWRTRAARRQRLRGARYARSLIFAALPRAARVMARHFAILLQALPLMMRTRQPNANRR